METEEIMRFFTDIASLTQIGTARSSARRILEEEQSRCFPPEHARQPTTPPQPDRPLADVLREMQRAQSETLGFPHTALVRAAAHWERPTRFEEQELFSQLVDDYANLEIGLYRSEIPRGHFGGAGAVSILRPIPNRAILGTLPTPGPNASCLWDARNGIPIIAFEQGLFALIDFAVPLFLEAFHEQASKAHTPFAGDAARRAAKAFAAGVSRASAYGFDSLSPQTTGDIQEADEVCRSIRAFIIAHELAHVALGHHQREGDGSADAATEYEADDLGLYSAAWALAYADRPVPPERTVFSVALFFCMIDVFARVAGRTIFGTEKIRMSDAHPMPLDRLERLAGSRIFNLTRTCLDWPGFRLQDAERMNINIHALKKTNAAARIQAAVDVVRMASVARALAGACDIEDPAKSLSAHPKPHMTWFTPDDAGIQSATGESVIAAFEAAARASETHVCYKQEPASALSHARSVLAKHWPWLLIGAASGVMAVRFIA